MPTPNKPDPIGDLFASANVQTIAPQAPRVEPRPSPRGDSLMWILVALAVIGMYANKHGMLPSLNPFATNLFGKSGLRVLAVYESQKGVPGALNGEVREYLTSHCAKDGKKHPEFRFLDKDTKFAPDQAEWKQVMDRGQKQLPWVVIASDKGNYEGPLPSAPSAVIDLLKKYGGP